MLRAIRCHMSLKKTCMVQYGSGASHLASLYGRVDMLQGLIAHGTVINATDNVGVMSTF